MSGDSGARHIEDVIQGYNLNETGDQKKIRIITWLQKRPGQRFDVIEVTAALGDELNIGQGQMQNYLNELAKDGVLEKHGEKRIGYKLADDIIIPAHYQVFAVLRHFVAIFDTQRWGIAGVLAISTVMWAALTVPFWFMWGTLVLLPTDSHGPVTEPQFRILAISMSLWLIIFVVSTSVLYRLHKWYRSA